MLTFTFQFMRACFPDTSESFTKKSLGGTLPIVIGRIEVFVDNWEQRSPQEGPAMTSRSRLLPALQKDLMTGFLKQMLVWRKR